MALFQARHTYEPGRPLEPWLFAIARNVAADHSRRRWSRASWEELTADLPERAEGDSPAAPPDIEGLLTRLPPAQREAFAMLKLDGDDAGGRGRPRRRLGRRVEGPGASRLQDAAKADRRRR